MSRQMEAGPAACRRGSEPDCGTRSREPRRTPIAPVGMAALRAAAGRLRVQAARAVHGGLGVAFGLSLLTAAGPASAAGSVLVAVQANLTSLDPYDANDTVSLAAAKAFYQGLYGFDKDMKLVKVLAEGHEVSADGKVYTIKLRSGVKFHDGTDFNAEAVRANFARVIDPANKLKRFSLYANIAKVEAPDARTVRFTLREPFSAFLNVLGHPSSAIISPAALAKHGKEIGQHPVGTGPFRFVGWNQTDKLKGVKFDGYWRAGYPKIDEIAFKPVVDNNTRSAMLQTGEAQFAFPLPYEQAELLKGRANVVVESAPSIINRMIMLNTTKKPFDNPKVRQAINYAINKEALVKVAFWGYAVPSTSPLPATMENAIKLGPWPYDPAKARELLKEAGLPNGFETTLWSAYNYSTAQKVIQFVQQQLGQVGIKVQVLALESGQRVQRVENVATPEQAEVRMYYVGWSSSTGEADWALRPLIDSQSIPPKQYNMAYLRDPQIDTALADALKTTDPAKKAAYYADVQKRMWDEAPWAFLVTERLLFAHAKGLSGFNMVPDGSFEFEEVELR